MNRIQQTFSTLKAKGEKALIPYISCGDPSLDFTEELILHLEQAGADLIEMGIPYSDPIADGPTIQKASQRALNGGVTLEPIFAMIERVRPQVSCPLLVMTYYNAVYRYGLEKFVTRCAKVGVDGMIVPDLPLEEAQPLKGLMDAHGLDLIFLVAPNTPQERLAKVARRARGFIYCVSVTGTTGSRKAMDSGLGEFLERVGKETPLPLAVGFGISNPQTAAVASQKAQGVIVGSALIDIVEQNLGRIPTQRAEVVEEIGLFLRSLKEAMNTGQN